MSYKYIKGCPNVFTGSSFAPSLWVNTITGEYYLSDEYMDKIKPSVDTSYMLLDEKQPTKYNPYKHHLSSSAVKISSDELKSGIGHYGKGLYKLH